MDRYVCIHGHFYQPPRENPWLESIELQDSAHPYHDWNERITDECYAPNTASRILDGEGRIIKIVNNYAGISFDFGPTLLDWLETRKPHVYRAVIEADRKSRERFSGHGSALALPYNHMIMPLANARDKQTQVAWGIRDFEHRFGRRPEGMFLPETAVDMETLDIMAAEGVLFTLLAPHQARRVRDGGDGDWREVGHRGVDPSAPYRVCLPSGRTITVFFYDGPISQALAFHGLLANGEKLVHRLLEGFDAERCCPELVHIATDGETYGHHFRHGDMALAYALHYIEANGLVRITNYGEYLELHPPTREAEIIEDSSWSCAHGVERWRANCGCNSGTRPGWGQDWRAPLRETLDWLRDTLAPLYVQEAGQLLAEPWAARDGYIAVVLDRAPENIARFVDRHAARALAPAEHVRVLKLLEMQRHAMLMYTSCGWFFDDISGIETVQVIQYAGRVLQLAEELFGLELEAAFLDGLARAKSNVPEHRDGAHVYRKFVKPARVDLPKVGAHYALSSLFEAYDDRSRIYCYTVDRLGGRNLWAGKAQLAVGRVRVTSEITREAADLSYGVVYFGYHNVNAAVRLYRDEESYQEMAGKVTEAFSRADLPGVIRLLDRYFDGISYSLKQLFRDKQRQVLKLILNSTLAEVEADYQRIYDRHASLMRFLKDLDSPQPAVLCAASEFVVNAGLRRAFAAESLDLERVNHFLKEARMCDTKLDGATLGYVLKQTVERMARRLQDDPHNLALLENLKDGVGLTRALPFEVDLWEVQNIYYALLQTAYPGLLARVGEGDEEARTWVDHFATLGDRLRVRGGA